MSDPLQAARALMADYDGQKCTLTHVFSHITGELRHGGVRCPACEALHPEWPALREAIAEVDRLRKLAQAFLDVEFTYPGSDAETSRRNALREAIK